MKVDDSNYYLTKENYNFSNYSLPIIFLRKTYGKSYQYMMLMKSKVSSTMKLKKQSMVE